MPRSGGSDVRFLSPTFQSLTNGVVWICVRSSGSMASKVVFWGISTTYRKVPVYDL